MPRLLKQTKKKTSAQSSLNTFKEIKTKKKEKRKKKQYLHLTLYIIHDLYTLLYTSYIYMKIDIYTYIHSYIKKLFLISH